MILDLVTIVHFSSVNIDEIADSRQRPLIFWSAVK